MSLPQTVIVPFVGPEAPRYATSGSAGADLKARIDVPVTLHPLQRTLISTELKIEIPRGYEGQIRSRSGLALKHGIMVLNSPGTIDSDYRGQIGVILINLGEKPFTIENGMAIAQLVIAPVIQPTFIRQITLSETVRGEGGFGSTGI
jgi:dUTP pyrophosphatase